MDDPDRPQVSVVIVTWNGAALLATCLASLEHQTWPRHRFRVIVVDNASTDGTAESLRRDWPQIEVIDSATNTGFAGGVSLGLAAVTTSYAVLLNNDAVADPALLESFVASLEAPVAPRVAAVTGRVVLAGSGLLNSTGNLVSRRGRGSDRDWLRPDDGSRVAGEVFGFCGAAVGLRMSAIHEVGSFDSSLFLYYEDTDLSWRLRAAGWTVRYEPAALATHLHASSSVVGSPLFTYWNERNSLLVFTRHAPLPLVLAAHARRALGLVIHTLRDPSSATTRARWRAMRDHLLRLPTTVAQRRSIWSDARVSRTEVARLLDSGS